MNTTNNTADLYFKSKQISLIMLTATAFIFSRLLFFFFNDPEGPNLLIVTVLALIILLLSVGAYLFIPFKIKGINRLLVVICIQILIITGLYFFMR